MTFYTACEQAYKNGFEAGKLAARSLDSEIITRASIAYKQLLQCYTKLSITPKHGVDEATLGMLQNVLSELMELQVQLGALKYEEKNK